MCVRDYQMLPEDSGQDMHQKSLYLISISILILSHAAFVFVSPKPKKPETGSSEMPNLLSQVQIKGGRRGGHWKVGPPIVLPAKPGAKEASNKSSWV